jgi:hypothetical protein
MDVKFIEENYRSLKPCLTGSDAHREETTAHPAMDRYCWLKGDLSFETLRQAIVEPETRTSIGAVAPAGALSSSTVTVVRPLNASWAKVPTEGLGLNAGLVAVIGARGSGKTALVDLIAVGTNSLDAPPSDSSFLKRALSPQDLLGNAAVSITWASGETKTYPIAETINEPDPFEAKQVCYLSQQFVERLCSSSGLATELRREMERVVFESTDSMNRLEAEDFEALATSLRDPIRARRRELQEAIGNIATRIVEERDSLGGTSRAAVEEAARPRNSSRSFRAQSDDSVEDPAR